MVVGPVIAWAGKVGDGVLGPREEGAEVKEDCDSAWDPLEEAMELTRGEEVPGEYACAGGRDAREGSLSPGIYDGREKGSENGTLSRPRVCTCEIDGRSSFTVQHELSTMGDVVRQMARAGGTIANTSVQIPPS